MWCGGIPEAARTPRTASTTALPCASSQETTSRESGEESWRELISGLQAQVKKLAACIVPCWELDLPILVADGQ